eukprot:3364940-Pleurochrysis_carterae.AAC.2
MQLAHGASEIARARQHELAVRGKWRESESVVGYVPARRRRWLAAAHAFAIWPEQKLRLRSHVRVDLLQDDSALLRKARRFWLGGCRHSKCCRRSRCRCVIAACRRFTAIYCCGEQLLLSLTDARQPHRTTATVTTTTAATATAVAFSVEVELRAVSRDGPKERDEKVLRSSLGHQPDQKGAELLRREKLLEPNLSAVVHRREVEGRVGRQKRDVDAAAEQIVDKEEAALAARGERTRRERRMEQLNRWRANVAVAVAVLVRGGGGVGGGGGGSGRRRRRGQHGLANVPVDARVVADFVKAWWRDGARCGELQARLTVT